MRRRRLQALKRGGCSYCSKFGNGGSFSLTKEEKEKEPINTNTNMAKCSVGDSYSSSSKSRSCLPSNVWNSLEDIYKRKKEKGNATGGQLSLMEELEKENPKCGKNELCLLQRNSILQTHVKPLIEKYFAPIAPMEWIEKPNTWLSNVDIEKVMNQYMKNHSSFDFVGTFPIDFDSPLNGGSCVSNKVCHFDLSSFIKEGKKQIGFIFNTDDHNGPGQHWISLFIHLPMRLIYFFDSTASPTPKEIQRLIQRIIEQGKEKLNITFNVMENTIDHQKGNTECGIYCLFFLDHMLMNPQQTIRDLNTKRFSDSFIQNFRHVYFNQPVDI